MSGVIVSNNNVGGLGSGFGGVGSGIGNVVAPAVENKKLSREEREIRTAERETRKVARKAKKEEWLANKRLDGPKESDEERIRRKEERKEKREERKAQREDKEKIRKFESSIVTEHFPDGGISHLFLDGNNMMFVAGCLRNMTLHKKQRQVERLFDRFTIQFLEASEKKIEKTTLVFDNTPAQREQKVKEGDFELCSARPRFVTSDDAIVQWVSDVKLSPGVKLCVTSDRGLIERIEKEGGMVMKPKKWMLLAAAMIAGQEVTSLDAWMDNWCNAQVDL